jgi:P-type Cu2+ transporter
LSATAPNLCFHCGQALSGLTPHTVMVEGAARSVCCAGCEAAANLIMAQGLQRYYQFRDAPLKPPRGEAHNWTIYDRDAALRRYTHRDESGERDVLVQVEGMHCAACAWLIENSLRRVDGVTGIEVNPSSARAALRFDPGRVSLGRLLQSIHTLGYVPHPLAFGSGDGDWSAERRSALQRLAVAGFGMMQVMTYAVSLYAGALQGIAPNLEHLLRFVSLLVSTPVVLYAAQPFFIGAWRALRAGTLGMDVPVALSIGAAYAWSVAATLRGSGTVYFDSAVMFTFFLLLARFIEMSLRHRSGLTHEAMTRLLPDSAMRLKGDGAERVMPEELIAGDRVRVLAGERIAADGEVLCGRTEVDEALLTGESLPKPREPGDPLIAGSVNLSGVIEMRVTHVGQDSTLAAVARLLERAHAARPAIADIADRVAAWFVAAVLLIAALVALYWLRVDAARAFPIVLAVLVVTCPCALSLATPAALAGGTARLARGGLLVARTRGLEVLARADCIVFDKTGTLTQGQPQLDEVRLLDDAAGRDHCLRLAATLERHSDHPIARAFADLTELPAAVRDVQIRIGEGVEACVDGALYRIGRASFVLGISGAAPAPRVGADAASDMALALPARTRVFLGSRNGLLAEFLLTDAIRSDARATLTQLQRLGLEPVIASGDRIEVVADVARHLGGLASHHDFRAEDKLALVQSLQRSGRVVAMVGDGVNDAPVLAGANVSIAIGGGTELAKVSADMVLLGSALAPLAAGIETARRTLGVIRQNMWWAVLYNAIAVPIAAAGWLAPWAAALGMSASSLLVTLNAMRLLRASPVRPSRGATVRAADRPVHA